MAAAARGAIAPIERRLDLELVRARTDCAERFEEAGLRRLAGAADEFHFRSALDGPKLRDRLHLLDDLEAGDALRDLPEERKIRRERRVVGGRRMQAREPSRSQRRGVEVAAEETQPLDRGDPVAGLERAADRFAKSVPAFELRIERAQEEDRAIGGDRIRRIEQEHRARLVVDAGQVFEVGVGPEGVLADRFAGEDDADGLAEPGEDLLAALRELRERNRGEAGVGGGCGGGAWRRGLLRGGSRHRRIGTAEGGSVKGLEVAP